MNHVATRMLIASILGTTFAAAPLAAAKAAPVNVNRRTRRAWSALAKRA